MSSSYLESPVSALNRPDFTALGPFPQKTWFAPLGRKAAQFRTIMDSAAESGYPEVRCQWLARLILHLNKQHAKRSLRGDAVGQHWRHIDK